jgi:hypothetical protein
MKEDAHEGDCIIAFKRLSAAAYGALYTPSAGAGC